MLSGRQPFQGDTVAEILAGVLARDPDLTTLSTNLNPRVVDLLRRCLEKDPKKRWHAAADTRVEIDAILADPRGMLIQSQPAFIQKPLWKRAIPAAAGLLAGAAIAGLVVWYLKPSPPAIVTRFPFTLAEGQQFTIRGEQFVAISPDGTQFAYVANNRLYLKAMGELNSIAIQGTEVPQGIINPAFSPDGRSIAFFSIGDRAFKRIAVSGGATVTICEADLPTGMSWGRDDQIVFGLGAKGVMRVSANGGKPETIVTLKAGEYAHGPQILPDGKTLLFTVASGTSTDLWEKGKIAAQSLKTGERKILIDGGTDGHYVRTGHVVYELNGNLLAVPFDLRRLQVTGGPVPIVEGVRTNTFTGTAQFSFAENGSLIYIPSTGSAAVATNSIAFVDRNGNARTLPIPPGPYNTPRVSPNGKQLTYQSNDGKEEIVWVYDLTGATAPRRLTFGGANRYPAWSGDGERIIFESDREGDRGLFWQRADGVGTAEHLTKPESGNMDVPNAWDPKTQLFTFMRGNGTSDNGLWTYSVTDKQTTVFFHVPSSSQYESSFSPDGHWLAYQSNESKTFEVYVQPFPATGAKFQITRGSSTTGQDNHHPIWSPGGNELYYANNQQLFYVSLQTQSGFAFSTAKPLPVKGFIQAPIGPRQFDLTKDGKQFVVIFPPGQTQASSEPRQAPQIQIVLNWFEDLKQRVPVR